MNTCAMLSINFGDLDTLCRLAERTVVVSTTASSVLVRREPAAAALRESALKIEARYPHLATHYRALADQIAACEHALVLVYAQ